MVRTTLFLDIDGVLNAISEGYPKQNTGWDEWATGRVSFIDKESNVSAFLRNIEPKSGFRITFSPQLLRRLEALAERDDVEIIWLTTWCEDARTHLCPVVELEGTEWKVLGREQYGDRDNPYNREDWWKFEAIKQWWESEERTEQFVWMDDDLRWEMNAMRWLKEDVGRSGLGISPQSMHGLTVKHIEAIEAFCDR